MAVKGGEGSLWARVEWDCLRTDAAAFRQRQAVPRTQGKDGGKWMTRVLSHPRLDPHPAGAVRIS